MYPQKFTMLKLRQTFLPVQNADNFYNNKMEKLLNWYAQYIDQLRKKWFYSDEKSHLLILQWWLEFYNYLESLKIEKCSSLK